MINVKQQPSSIGSILSQIDRQKNIVIIGKAATSYASEKVMYFESEDIVRQHYGESQLTDAFVLAKKMGVPHIFLVNAKDEYSIVAVSDVLRQHDFAYIVPLFNIRDGRQGGKFLFEYLIENMWRYNRSIVIMTDIHASLYEDIDHYLNDMFEIESSVFSRSFIRERLVFVLNHLEDVPYSNLIVASSIVSREYGQIYPEVDEVNTIYNIDYLDILGRSLVFFEKSVDGVTTIENLVNFEKKSKPEKSVLTLDTLNRVYRSFDFGQYYGRQYNPNVLYIIRKLITEKMDDFLGIYIADYSIKDIQFIKERLARGRIEISMEIKDLYTFEVCEVVLEV